MQQARAGYARQVGAVYMQSVHAGCMHQGSAGMGYPWHMLPTLAFAQPETASRRGVPAAYTLLSMDS